MILEARLVPPERVRVVPHGGPTELLPPGNGHRRLLRLPRRHVDESAYAIDEDRRVLATFGLISPGKGIETAIAPCPPSSSATPRRCTWWPVRHIRRCSSCTARSTGSLERLSGISASKIT